MQRLMSHPLRKNLSSLTSTNFLAQDTPSVSASHVQVGRGSTFQGKERPPWLFIEAEAARFRKEFS
ncbi:hypothetical protein K469DRAFT_790798 [Zopfia rhizophila CBS 207.26]|uniref:Uncharacterized protein n=1 Tax=Zopfia rhizophila CBS 207.26 TaxID=1314779 RepID=A0A6A6DR47_9PEZI|nr:hypothetical protein K469DRAFT_790798 [Zopfia rhizophila CBS 207.26]